jgi:hypothetical protein
MYCYNYGWTRNINLESIQGGENIMIRLYYLPSIVITVIVTFCLSMTVPAYAQESANLKVEDGAVCRNVVNYEIIEEGTSFPASVGKLYCFTRIVGAKDPAEITHVWYYGDTERARIVLAVDSPNWRTYSSKIIDAHEVGAWQVVVLDSSDNVLDSFRFDIIQE